VPVGTCTLDAPTPLGNAEWNITRFLPPLDPELTWVRYTTRDGALTGTVTIQQPFAGLIPAVPPVERLRADAVAPGRFTVTADAHTKDRRTLGVPIPIGAGYAMAVTLMRDHLTPWEAAGMLVLMALLMVSRLRLPQIQKSPAVNLMIVIGIGNYLAVVAWPSWTTVVWWNVWNVVILATAWLEERRHRDEEDEAPEPRTT
jgi:hypothetical protein